MKIIENDARAARDAAQGKTVENILCKAKVLDNLVPLVESVVQEIGSKNDSRFLVLLASATAFDTKGLFLEQKRYSDILVEIDEAKGCYAMVCLDTGVEGGFHFAQRLLRHMKTGFAEHIYLAAVDVRCASCGSHEIVNKLFELYRSAKRTWREGEAVLQVLR